MDETANDYYYELKYVDGQHTVTHRFSAQIDMTTLADNLKDFLRGCSWLESQVDKIIN